MDESILFMVIEETLCMFSPIRPICFPRDKTSAGLATHFSFGIFRGSFSWGILEGLRYDIPNRAENLVRNLLFPAD